jgi:hypothetical protein
MLIVSDDGKTHPEPSERQKCDMFMEKIDSMKVDIDTTVRALNEELSEIDRKDKEERTTTVYKHLGIDPRLMPPVGDWTTTPPTVKSKSKPEPEKSKPKKISILGKRKINWEQ